MTDEQHNQYIAWVFVAHGAFQTLMGLLIVGIMMLFAFLPVEPDGEAPFAVFALIGFMVFFFQLLFAVPGFIAAYGLFKKRSWARIASIVAGVVSAMNVPIGTAACVYALWFFLGENWKTIYEPASASSPAGLNAGSEAHWEPYVRNEHGEVVYRNFEPPDWR